MKKLSELRSNAPSHPIDEGAVVPEVVVEAVADPAPPTLTQVREKLELNEAETESLDPVGAALVHLENIMSMSDDMITTLGELDHVDLQVVHSLKSVNDDLSQIFGAIDVAVGITPTDFRWADYSDQMSDYHTFESGVDHGTIEFTTEDVNIDTVNPVRFKQLADIGLVSPEESVSIVKTLKQLAADKPITTAQKLLVNTTFLKLVALITGDTSVFNKVSSTVKKKSLNEDIDDLILEGAKEDAEFEKRKAKIAKESAKNTKKREAYAKKMLAGAKSGKFKSFVLKQSWGKKILIIDDKHNAIAAYKDGSYLADYGSVRGIPLGKDNRYGSLQYDEQKEADKILADLGYQPLKSMFDEATPPSAKAPEPVGEFKVVSNGIKDSEGSVFKFVSSNGPNEGFFLFKVGRAQYRVDSRYHSGKIWADVDNRSDRTWNSLEEFAKFLNDNKADYNGFDRGDG